MTKPSILAIDTLDDRREIFTLLHRLPPRRRVGFLDWCCRQVVDARGNRPTPSLIRMGPTIREAAYCDRADTRLTTMIYTDLLLLSCNMKLDLVKTAIRLERTVRKGVAPAAAS